MLGKIRPMVAAILLVVLLAACVPATAPAPAPAPAGFSQYQHGKPYRFIGTNNNVPVVKIMMAGFKQACVDYGLACEFNTVSGNDIAGSVTQAEQAVAQGSAGIVDTVYNDAQLAAAKKAIAAGIPVVNAHFPLKQSDVPGLLAWVAPDNVGYAVLSADVIAGKVGCKGSVAVTVADAASTQETGLAKAFGDEMAKQCPAVRVLATQVEGTDKSVGLPVISAIIQANPDLSGAFSTTGGGITNWSLALKELKRGGVTVIGMDYSQENIDHVKAGDAYALVAQPLYDEMYEAVVVLLLHDMGFVVPFENVLPAPLVTKDGLGRYQSFNDLAAKFEMTGTKAK